MSDNVVLNIPDSAGATIATDDVGGVQHQLIKIEWGADGVATPVTAAAPLPVTDAALLTELQLKADLTETQPVSVATLPLPSGAATAANQTTEIAGLASIDGKLTGVALAANQQTNALTDAQLRASAVPISGTVTATPTGTQNVDVTANTIGLATGTKQDTGNTSVASIDTKTPALGQALAAASTPVVLTAAQVSTLTPPAAITGFGLETTQLLQATAAKQDLQTALLTTIDGDTSNLDVLLSTRLKAADTLAAVTLVSDTRQATAANLNMTEASAAAILAKIIAAPATEAKQDTGNTSLSSIDGKFTTLNAKDFATQTTLAAFFAALGLSQGADATSATGPMTQALVNDTPNSYITGNIHPLSLTSEGRLRVSTVPSEIQNVWNNTFNNPFFDNDLYASNLNFFY